ncbi:hypothetical protein LTR85_001478 [Meristemomyces frigidus]|nr:hypothetical protein LTR85_001478 [Meristemomyces frigidus]
MSTKQRQSVRACRACHLRKVRCDLDARASGPCARCEEAGVQCQTLVRRRRPIRAIIPDPASAVTVRAGPSPLSEDDLGPEAPGTISDAQLQTSITISHALEEAGERYNTLGIGDAPRRVAVLGIGDISQQSSILVDFLSQDFSRGSMDDYQVTFVDNYTTVTRVLADEFGQGFKKDGVNHHRDAPFVKRCNGSMPKSLTHAEKAVLELRGAFMLPSNPIADSLVTSFFDRVHPALPILDRGAFMKRYYLTGSSTTCTCDTLLLLQSVLLSGSTAYRHPSLSSTSHEISWKLYVRAKTLVENGYEQDRLTLVQAHLLFSTFTGDSCDDTLQNMWLSIGSAVRIAQELGMHRSLGNASASPAMRREWKRIWWTLFVHDTLCSFEWGRPRAIFLADSDVEDLIETDFQADEPGSLPSSEHAQFFVELCKLCRIISCWLDLLRPGANAGIPSDERARERTRQTQLLLSELQEWRERLPASMQTPPPSRHDGLSLWTATLHITFEAALLRLSTLLPDGAAAVFEAAAGIIDICSSLKHRELLDSLWSFGVHDLDLALGQQARCANSQYAAVSSEGTRHLRRGLPLLQQLCHRNSVASQGAEFFDQLLQKLDQRCNVHNEASVRPLETEHEHSAASGSSGNRASFDGDRSVSAESEQAFGLRNQEQYSAQTESVHHTAIGEWPPILDFSNLQDAGLPYYAYGNAYGWDQNQYQ